MEEYQAFFKGKRITLMGLGLLGRGIGDAKFLARCGADLTITDLKDEAQLRQSLDALREFPDIRYTLGRHDPADFENRDLIIHAAGVAADSPYLAEARKRGIPVTQSSALFARFAKEAGATLVGVTGTRGKTTVSFMIAQILNAAGKKVLLGGNVPGVSTLALMPEVIAETVAVLELDSWQLQGFREEKISPGVAVFTTFYPDHLNYYRGDMDQYLADKAEIFLHQYQGDALILGEQCAALVQEKYGDRIRSRAVVARAADVPRDLALAVPGEHNRRNASCALCAARALGIAGDIGTQALEEFKGVEGRLQLVREVRGVNVYNDTTATTPEATVAALRALDPSAKKNIVLIMGGSDKGLDMGALFPEIEAHCTEVILLSGTGTERIQKKIQESFPGAMLCHGAADATRAAIKAADAGDIVLFSPAFASFGMFKNEYDRGEQFIQAVNRLA